MVAGSNPAEPTSEVKSFQSASDSFQNAQVQPPASELLQLRELTYILLGNKGKRHLELRQKTNDELFVLYDDVLQSDFFSHFVARNEGQFPVVEIEISLFDDENKLLAIHRESVLGVHEEFHIKTGMLNEGKYQLVGTYRPISSNQVLQTLLPFKVNLASKKGEIFVLPEEMIYQIGTA